MELTSCWCCHLPSGPLSEEWTLRGHSPHHPRPAAITIFCSKLNCHHTRQACRHPHPCQSPHSTHSCPSLHSTDLALLHTHAQAHTPDLAVIHTYAQEGAVQVGGHCPQYEPSLTCLLANSPRTQHCWSHVSVLGLAFITGVGGF